MVRFIGKVVFVMASCVHSVQAETSGQCGVPDFGPNVDMSACTGLIPPDSCTVQCTAGYIGSPTTLHCYSDDDGFLGSSPDCSKGPEAVISAVASTSRQLPADERQLNSGGVTTTTVMPGSCSVPDLGNSIDASACFGLFPGMTCKATCASGFEGSEETYTCDSVQFTVLGTKPVCTAKPLVPSSAELKSVRDSLWSNAATTRVVVDSAGDATIVAEKVSLAAVVAAGGALKVEGNDTDGASVTVPKALFDLLGNQVVVVMASDGKSMANQKAEDGSTIEVQGVLSVLVSTQGNDDPKVSGLSTPVAVTLGTLPNSVGKLVACVFYNETLGQWSSKGVKTVGEPSNGVVTCETTHLTTFGAVLKTPVLPVCGFDLGQEVYYGTTKATVTCYAKVNGADALGICSEGGGGRSHFSVCSSEIKSECGGKLMFVGCGAVSEETVESGSFRATAASMLGLMLAFAITLFV